MPEHRSLQTKQDPGGLIRVMFSRIIEWRDVEGGREWEEERNRKAYAPRKVRRTTSRQRRPGWDGWGWGWGQDRPLRPGLAGPGLGWATVSECWPQLRASTEPERSTTGTRRGCRAPTWYLTRYITPDADDAIARPDGWRRSRVRVAARSIHSNL